MEHDYLVPQLINQEIQSSHGLETFETKRFFLRTNIFPDIATMSALNRTEHFQNHSYR